MTSLLNQIKIKVEVILFQKYESMSLKHHEGKNKLCVVAKIISESEDLNEYF